MSRSLIQEFLEFIATFLLINGLMKKGTKSLAHYCFHRVDHLFKNVLFLKYNLCVNLEVKGTKSKQIGF